MTSTAALFVADEAWIALATLQREQPDRESFSAKEILARAKTLNLTGELRPGVQIHISLHNVGNIAPNRARYCMFFRPTDGVYRLFRPDDRRHPARTGKTAPAREDLPAEYRSLIDWYQQVYCKKRLDVRTVRNDPVLQMRGLGKEIWAGTNADDYVAGLRAGWDE